MDLEQLHELISKARARRRDARIEPDGSTTKRVWRRRNGSHGPARFEADHDAVSTRIERGKAAGRQRHR